MAATAMSIGIIVLTIATFYTPVAAELMWALTIPLSGMAGLSYASVERVRLQANQTKINLANQTPSEDNK